MPVAFAKDGTPVALDSVATIESVFNPEIIRRQNLQRREAVFAGVKDRSVGEVETVELTAGRRHTVIASVPGTEADHLLTVTAEGVSPPLLEAWTRLAAEDLRQALSVGTDVE